MWSWWSKKETLRERFERIKKELAAGGAAEAGFEVDQSSTDLYNLLNPMLFVGNLIYSFAYLRKIARKEELEKEHLIMADPNAKSQSCDRVACFAGRMAKTKITAGGILEFIQANIERLDNDDEINSDLSVYALLSLSKLNDAYIASFDDKFEDTNMVYGITVNKIQKRISLVFRGTATETNNWSHNMQTGLTKMETPTMLTDELGFSADKTILVHTGFKAYVFNNVEPDPNKSDEPYGKQKYNEIKQSILDLYEQDGCEGYDLCVTGHSLGGALSTLVSFELASSKKMAKHLDGKPVINASFASPYVGGTTFKEAFQALESAGKVKHIRVSNSGDVVAVSAPLNDYTHVGLNLYLNPKARDGYELAYRGNRTMWWQWNLDPLSRHSLVDYWDRKKAIRNHIGGKTLEELYSDKNVTKDFKV
mmetsp:Transcript_46062/g.70455  ORF Transcript_46062/g.70455 Transcript_46062/m.70455 type:complete len:422 (-) Transcript_46062:32-1297(-)|eukprot:CAMPEP_0117012052 /NCGR_PEP_ID=MMETSP0472-20121206/10229_1 /TAXON_ID=693140 ORGANISM="Tiarina fusus, Strain LIS" /NCGR_SAMPLE_ID=MMETSP0472 /ASSEMBLY_ACC=CAM_ASM_000603 /LENGTH=421 /DNA_ID=CAMNT_0004715029 /DNA_START=122 /DNA_END=1387 /DNA_ORIENTATION=-